jgi:hypothetical protein
MFYYLLYNSTFEFINSNRLFTTILYGSILYILTHAILNYCNIDILGIIKNYFWIIFILDITAFIWTIYNILSLPVISTHGNENDLHVSFNLLKNKVNTFLDNKNNNLTISTPIHYPGNNPIAISNPPITPTKPTYSQQPIKTNSSMSTPISQILQKNQKTNTLLNQPIDIPEIKINDDITNENMGGSIAGSDVGNVMDLEDFEKML